MRGLQFANPWLLLLLLPVLYYLWRERGRTQSALAFSRAGMLHQLTSGADRVLAVVPGALRVAAVVALIVAVAGPRTGSATIEDEAEGIAIMLVVDISSSMLAEDFSPRNRMQVAKQMTAEFVSGRRFDRIGLVAFAGEALTQVPLTTDYPVLYQAIDYLQAGQGQLEDGTAIGTAIATAANRLRNVEQGARVMVLLTDGENNRGEIDPLTAAQAAHAFDIRIYTVGIGTEGMAPIPVASGPFGVQYANMPVSIDEDLLREISDMTGGRYFRALDAAGLDAVFREINRLEAAPVAVTQAVHFLPRHLPFLLIAALALLGEWLVRASRWGRLP
jgi:Ca-activated chloride channel homolog